MTTAFFSDERCFWHAGGNYAFTLPVGDLVQPIPGGLPENPETKRRLRNLIEVTGLLRHLSLQGAEPASTAELLRVHPESYLQAFKALSDAGGGELGLRTPFGKGGYEIAALSAGLATAALRAVLSGEVRNAYALSRPPGHHCTADFPNGFCLLNNIAVAIRAAQAEGRAQRVAVVDWDVHHGNGSEAIFWEDPRVGFFSIHRWPFYPGTGDVDETGGGAGLGTTANVPVRYGTTRAAYLESFRHHLGGFADRFRPQLVLVSAGFDAHAEDPVGSLDLETEDFITLTQSVKNIATAHAEGRLVSVLEGGYNTGILAGCVEVHLRAMIN